MILAADSPSCPTVRRRSLQQIMESADIDDVEVSGGGMSMSSAPEEVASTFIERAPKRRKHEPISEVAVASNRAQNVASASSTSEIQTASIPYRRVPQNSQDVISSLTDGSPISVRQESSTPVVGLSTTDIRLGNPPARLIDMHVDNRLHTIGKPTLTEKPAKLPPSDSCA